MCSFTARQGQVTALVGAVGEVENLPVQSRAARFWDIDRGKDYAGRYGYQRDRAGDPA